MALQVEPAPATRFCYACGADRGNKRGLQKAGQGEQSAMTNARVEREISQVALTEGVRKYYDRQRDDRNLLLAGDSGIVNHHFGIGDFERRKPLGDFSQEEITAILGRLETNEIDVLLNRMGEIRPEHRVLDAGCGRGGTAFSIAERFGATVDGITISSYQHEFARELAKRRGVAERARFHRMNYLELAFPDKSFDHVVTNESTQYVVDAGDLFAGFARVLRPGGRYTCATWCINEQSDGDDECVELINLHYGTSMNSRREYVQALEANGFTRIAIEDYTEQAIPYWELRCGWEHSSRVELPFLNGHRQRKILYLIITALL
jgi:geranyl diphosphate 2-C-methyltransferase